MCWLAETGENRWLADRNWREQEAGWQGLERTGGWMAESGQNRWLAGRHWREQVAG